jgi:short-subunit dehydrogenase
MTGTRIFQKGDLMPPREVALAAYKAFQNGDRVCVPGTKNRALVAKRRFLTIPATAKLNEKFYEEVPYGGRTCF